MATNQNTPLPREFEFTDDDFQFLRNLVLEKTGISLSDSKREMIYRRVGRRLRELNLNSFYQYGKLLRKDAGDELVLFTNAITTNLTAFFREPHHFKFLSNNVLPELIRAGKDKLRFWSAGCSTGEEPYSIAITIKKYFQHAQNNLQTSILATDIDTSVLKKAKQGFYNSEIINDLDFLVRKNWFSKTDLSGSNHHTVKEEVKNLVNFKTLNLVKDWSVPGMFDVIFCRNVIIYFDKSTQKKLIDRFADTLEDNGYLFLGHSESLFHISERFELVGHTIYRKTS